MPKKHFLLSYLILSAIFVAILKDAFPQEIDAETKFPSILVPRFSIPQITHPPVIDGRIEQDEWSESVRLTGMSQARTARYYGRQVAFRCAWDREHLYIAARSVLRPGEVLRKAKRRKYTRGLVYDDTCEFGLFLPAQSETSGEGTFNYKFRINPVGAGEYFRVYPDLAQHLYNWRPEMEVGNRIYPAETTRHFDEGAKYWDMEIAIDLEDVNASRPFSAGDAVRILLGRNFKNPWRQVCTPASRGLEMYKGFPKARLSAGKPFVQINQLSGLLDKKLRFQCEITNPSSVSSTVRINLKIREENSDDTVFSVKREVTIDGGQKHELAIDYNFSKKLKGPGIFNYRVKQPDSPDALPIYDYALKFQKDTDKGFLSAPSRFDKRDFRFSAEYNPVKSTLLLTGDTLDANVPEDAEIAGMEYEITAEGSLEPLFFGRITQLIHEKYKKNIELRKLSPGRYKVVGSLVNQEGKKLGTEKENFRKLDEEDVFSEWWDNDIGSPQQILPPFKPIKIVRKAGLLNQSTVLHPVLRHYHLDGLGFPRGISTGDEEILRHPARIIFTTEGEDYRVPAKGGVKIVESDPSRVVFKGASRAGGIRFETRGRMDQDGLVDMRLTMKPGDSPIKVQSLRLEWPLDDAEGNYMAVIGPGANYSARDIGKVPPGQGVVWDVLSDIGRSSTGMTKGNFMPNLWVGNEKKGFLWSADSDQGWVPNNKVSSHALVRNGNTLILRNNIIGTAPTQTAFRLEEPRTIHFQYNASPFKPLIPGWRINLRSAANGFGNIPGYQINPETDRDGWHLLHPPTDDKREWPRFYKRWKERAEANNLEGLYAPAARSYAWNNNQIPLIGYSPKSIEPGVYPYFATEWTIDDNETLAETYTDYMVHLMQQQVKKAGARNFYFDASQVTMQRKLAADVGYRLPDGRVQPEFSGNEMRRWYMRTYAMMHENGIFPPGVDAHATNSFCLKSLSFADAVADAEYPMKDPVNTFPSERMIALSCPHNFGFGINHLKAMNPDWAALHDATTTGAQFGSSPFDQPAFRHWGIARKDVDFIPYWRNHKYIRHIPEGLKASMWKRPGSLIIGVINYGPDPEGREHVRPVRMILNLEELGIPTDLEGNRLRIKEFIPEEQAPRKYLGQYAGFRENSGKRIPADLNINPNTGGIHGMKLFYHDVRYIRVDWEAQPVEGEPWQNLFPDRMHRSLLDWDINTAKSKRLNNNEISENVSVQQADFDIELWRKPGSILLRIANERDNQQTGRIFLDMETLGIDVTHKWQQYMQVYPIGRFDGGNLEITRTTWTQPQEIELKSDPKRVYFSGHLGLLGVTIPPEGAHVLTVDTYPIMN